MQIPILNFSGGEVSPDIYGKLDNPLYQSSGRRMINLVPRIQGPMQGRSGSAYSNTMRNNLMARIEQFKYSDTQVFILCFTDLMLRIVEEAALTLEPSGVSISAITQDSPGVITATAHGFSDGDEVYLSGIAGMIDLNGRFVRIVNSTTDTFEIYDLFDDPIDTSDFDAYTSGGLVTKVFEVASPYSEAQLEKFDMAQAANVAYTHHRDVAPHKLTRVSASSWTFATYSRTNDPFGGANDYPGTCTFMEGRLISAGTKNNPDGCWMSRSPDTATGAPRYSDYTNDNGDPDEAIQIPLSGPQGDVETINWIRAGRKFLAAGTPNGVVGIDGGTQGDAITPATVRVRPIDSYGTQAVWPVATGSIIYYIQKGGKFLRSLEYDLVSDGDKSFDRSFVAGHIVGKGVFTKIAFQRGSPDILFGVTSLGALIGYTVKPKEDVSGWHRYQVSGKVISITTEPIATNVDRLWMVVERKINGATVRYMEYLTEPFQGLEPIDYYTGDKEADLSVFINEMYEEQRRIKYLDCHLVYDGSILGGRTITPADTEGEEVTFTVSSSLFTADDVGREIHKKYSGRAGGGIAEIIEFVDATHVKCLIKQAFDSDDTIAAGEWYLTTGRIKGLYHLEGETVRALVDGRVHPDIEVVNGEITLDFQAGFVVPGLPYQMLWASHPPAIVFATGNTLSRNKNITSVDVLVYNTLGMRYGTDLYNLQEVPASVIGQVVDRPPFPFTGIIPNHNAVEWKEHLILYIVQDLPYPIFVNAINLEVLVGE